MAKSKLKENAIPVFLGLAIVLATLWLRVTTIEPFHSWIEKMDFMAYDMQFTVIPEERSGSDGDIIIIDVDEKSLAKFGSWPWPRTVVAELVNNLFEQGALVVAFDVVFPNEEGNMVEEILKKLPEEQKNNEEFIKTLMSLTNKYENDNAFFESVAKGDTVLGVIFHNRSKAIEGILPEAHIIIDHDLANSLTIPEMEGYTGNVKELQVKAKYGGFITTTPDSDGVIRRSPLLIRNGNEVYLSLALEATRLFMLIDDVTLDVQEIGDFQVVEAIKMGKKIIPTDAFGRVMVPYRGGSGSFPYVSALDVIEGKEEPGILENKIVFVGTSALGMGDLRAVPTQSVFPGVEVHATIADGIISRGFPVKPSWALGAEFLLILIIGFMCALIFPFLGPAGLTITALTLPASLLFFNAWLWSSYGLILSFTVPMIAVVACAMMNMAYGFIFESRSKKLIKWMFGQYVPTAHVEQMTQNPGDYGMSVENRMMSVLFADIRNFTTISEKLEASELKNLLNEFFTPMTKLIFDHNGTIDKYVGDMIMAFWGAPLKDENHAMHALEAGLEMIEEVKRLKPKFQELGLPEIDIGIGINSGVVSVGDMGSEYRRSYTVIGDTVNLASRLESLTKFYGVQFIVGEYTQKANPDIVFKTIDRVRVKGKMEAIEVYEPVCKMSELDNDKRYELETYHDALKLYFKGKWKRALKDFKKLKSAYPNCILYQIYFERIKEANGKAPKKWDGVYIRNEK